MNNIERYFFKGKNKKINPKYIYLSLCDDVNDYFYHSILRTASYAQLFNHFKKKYKFKEDPSLKYNYNKDLASAFILATGRPVTQEDIDYANNTNYNYPKTQLANIIIPYPMSEDLYLRMKVVKDRLKDYDTEQREKRSYTWALVGIFLGTAIGLIQLYDIYLGKDHFYEKTVMEQNDKIIELLEKGRKDTVVVHISAPPLK